MDWIESLNRALGYVEEHLADDCSLADAARAGGFSPFYLQRVFSAMAGLSLSEYVKERRLSLAGQALQSTNAKVIDVALQYGYETPESFQKAFQRFHGVTPSAAKRARHPLRYRNPLHIQVTLTGGTLMDYQLENMDAFTVLGKSRSFRFDSAFDRIPAFWDEYARSGACAAVPGYLGICLPPVANSPEFEYLIAGFCEPDAAVPEGFRKVRIEPHTWMKFRAAGALPGALQRLNRRIYTEWLPNNAEYEAVCDMNLELYSQGDMSSPDYKIEIWLPVRKKAKK